MAKRKKEASLSELEELRARVEYLEAENALLKKVKALVEARDAHLKGIGQKPSTN
jgi:cell division protein FtsB